MINQDDTLKLCGKCGYPIKRVAMLTSVIDHCAKCAGELPKEQPKKPPSVIYLGDDAAEEEDYIASNGFKLDLLDLDILDLPSGKKGGSGI